MKINYGAHYKNSEKNIKRKYKEQEMLLKIKNHIKQCTNVQELISSPISIMYGYEDLKYELSGYSSFNLCKNGGKVRLIFTADKELQEIILEYVSVEHYEDFKNKL